MLLRGINVSSYYREEMNAITKKSALLCYDISLERKKMIDMINENIGKIHKKLTNESLYLEYESILTNHFNNREVCIKEILDNFLKSYKLDCETKSTNFGVHKENYNFILNGKNARSFSSQGQKRNIIISVKMVQKDIFENNKEVKPIILLDDLFSELDENRRYELIEYLTDNQVFITTTDLHFLKNKKLNIVELEKINR